LKSVAWEETKGNSRLAERSGTSQSFNFSREVASDQ